MARRPLTFAVVLAPAAALLLTACGAAKPHSGISGIASGPPVSPSSDSGPTAAGVPKGAPRVRLPSDVHVLIDSPAPQASTAAVVSDLKYAILALRDGFAQGDGQVPSMLHAYADNAGLFWAKRISASKSQGHTITGTYRYYDLSAHLNNANTAGAGFCEDQRQAFGKDIKSGKVLRTAPSNSDFYRFTAMLTKNASGTWQISDESWVQGDTSCIRA